MNNTRNSPNPSSSTCLCALIQDFESIAHHETNLVLGTVVNLIKLALAEFASNIPRVEGGAFLAEFENPFRAIECALSIQKQVATGNFKVPFPHGGLESIEVAIGLGGNSASAAIISAESAGGQILLPREICEVLRARMPRVKFQLADCRADLGRGFSDLYEAIWHSNGNDHAVPRWEDIARLSPMVVFLQKERLHEKLAHHLINDPHPLAVVHGPPGLGQTALALATYHDERLAKRFPCRLIIFCDQLRSANQVRHRVHEKLLWLSQNLESSQPANTSQQAPTLILLDGMEQILEHDRERAESYLNWLWATCGHCLLLTCRLADPPTIHWNYADIPATLEDELARKLFLEFASPAMKANVAVDSQVLDRLLRQMNGFAEAIELLGRAAARGFYDVRSLSRAWNKQTISLFGHHHDYSFNTSLSCAMKLVFENDQADQKAGQLLTLVCLLPDGIHREDLDVIWPNWESHVATLLYFGLISRDFLGDHNWRVRFPSIYKECMRKQTPPSRARQLQLARHYANKLISTVGKLFSPEVTQAEAVDCRARLVSEPLNYGEMLILLGRLKPADVQLLNSAIAAYGRFVRYTGYGSAKQLQALIKEPLEIRARPWVAPTCVAIGEISLWHAGENEVVGADFWFERALRLTKDGLLQADSLRGLADWLLIGPREDRAQARSHYEAACLKYQELGHNLGLANCHLGLGEIAFHNGEFIKAKELFDRANRLYREIHSWEGQGNCYLEFGELAKAGGDINLARTHYNMALGFFERIDDSYSIGRGSHYLAKIARNPKEQKYYLQEAAKLWLAVKREDLVVKMKEEFPNAGWEEKDSPAHAMPNPANDGLPETPHIEFVLGDHLSGFDEKFFKLALQQASGVEASRIRVVYVLPGSTRICIEVDSRDHSAMVHAFNRKQEHLLAIPGLAQLLRISWIQNGSECAVVFKEQSGSLGQENSSKTKNGQLEVFISYSHKDEEFLEKLHDNLALLRNEGLIKTWYDRKIDPGTEWANKIDQHLESADIILLMISENFFASDYCSKKECEKAMERHEKGTACVIPIVLQPMEPGWKNSKIGKLKALPKDAEPITRWTNRQEAYADIALGVRQAVEQILRVRESSGGSTRIFP